MPTYLDQYQYLIQSKHTKFIQLAVQSLEQTSLYQSQSFAMLGLQKSPSMSFSQLQRFLLLLSISECASQLIES
ncbi:unnamed protein product [Paramecium octaurelia]|uniref:Uncharacterized protein n=1 Tax=Paramecium octaurelia TaxID=43137 RepID=A0A8S1Y5M9_PAROT|nr:unnamed protein product [Paramecium octaurelia]